MIIDSFEDEFNENETQDIIDTMIIYCIVAWVLQINENDLPEIKYLSEATILQSIQNVNVRGSLISKIKKDVKTWKLIRPQCFKQLLLSKYSAQFGLKNYCEDEISDDDF